jgi:hypothetical protein
LTIILLILDHQNLLAHAGGMLALAHRQCIAGFERRPWQTIGWDDPASSQSQTLLFVLAFSAPI